MAFLNHTGSVSINVLNATNSTTQWGSQGSFITLTTITVVLNAAILLILLKEKGLHSSFTVYMVGLLLCNILYTGLVNPTEILRQIHGNLWLGKRGCDLRIASEWILSAVTKHAHLLITINRGWALVFPVSYRENHSVKTAWIIFFGMVVYVCALVLPGVILDSVFYRRPLEDGCGLNTDAQFTWSVVIQFVIFDFPVVFIAGSYPFLLWLHIKQKKKSTRVTGSRTHEKTEATHAPHAVSIANASMTTKKQSARQEKRNRSKPFVVLTLLTTGVVICWTPNMVYYTIGCFTSTDNMQGFSNVAIFVYSLQGLIDPVSFAFSITWFRRCLSKGCR